MDNSSFQHFFLLIFKVNPRLGKFKTITATSVPCYLATDAPLSSHSSKSSPSELPDPEVQMFLTESGWSDGWQLINSDSRTLKFPERICEDIRKGLYSGDWIGSCEPRGYYALIAFFKLQFKTQFAIQLCS